MSRFTVHHVALAAALVFAACAKPEGIINRVQPNYYDKSFFVGQDFEGVQDDPEFYSRGTLVDVGYGAGQDGLFTSTYAQQVSRVKWEVTETMLIARLAYERIADSDGKGLSRATQNGIVVAAYPITSHFDIARDYNPNTGEQTNVINENTQDRPWNKRQFIRVNWSKNLSTDNYDYDTLSMIGVIGGISYEPMAYDITDPNSEDAPHIDEANGYLDITNKAFATPGVIDLSYLGWDGISSYPACFLDADVGGGSAPTTQCSPVELTIRQAFKKVPDNDYEPADWDGLRFQAFGAFTTDRKGYARNYGMTDTQWHRFISRYNLWERSHYYTDAAKMTGAIECYTPSTTTAGKDPHRDENGDGTDDECALAGAGSVCDTFSQKCTLPYANRTAKPVVWFYGEGSNPEYFDSTRAAAHEWDVALRVAVQSSRYAECVRTQGGNCQERFPMYFGQQDDNDQVVALAKEVDDCREGLLNAGATNCEALADSLGQQRGLDAAIIGFAKQPEMLVLCHSPVEAGDPAACPSPRLPSGTSALDCFAARLAGDRDSTTAQACKAAVSARNGDLRYNTVNVITSPQTPSPWGIMVDADDPLSGEKIVASINVWSHVTDLASQQLVDTARYIKGELTTADVTEGTYVRDWAAAARNASAGGSQPLMNDDQRLETIAKSVGFKGTLQEFKGGLENYRASPIYAQTRQLMNKVKSLRFDARAMPTSAPAHNARRVKALGSDTEAALTTPAMLELAGVGGTNAALPTNLRMAMASPLRGANPNIAREMNRRKELAYAARGSCVLNEAPAPLGTADIADILEAKFGAFNPSDDKAVQAARAEKMRKYIAYKYNYAVLAHEMGHSMGLRHNFVSSADPLNYRPQYWQLRTNDGTAPLCTGVDPTGACVGGRWQDPMNTTEHTNLLPMFMQSTVMDYPGELSQDMMGLGAYDFAAARMFYADVTSVANDTTMYAGSPVAGGLIDKLDNFGGITGIQYKLGVGDAAINIHYSALQQNYKLLRDCTEVADPTIYKPATWDEATHGTWHPVMDGLIVKAGASYTHCRQIPVDYVNWRSLRAPTETEGSSQDAVAVVDPYNRVRFPYGFASDNWADTGNLSVFRHDNGGDAYELFDFLITTQEMNHIFDNYRRNRNTFSVRSASNRTKERYNEKMRDAAKGLGLYANLYRDFSANSGYEFESLWGFFLGSEFADSYLAAGLAFDHFARQAARPEVGPHTLVDGVLRSNSTLANYDGNDVTVPNGASGYFRNVTFGGRLVENTLSETNGDYDSEYTLNAGSYYDKAWVPLMMTESEDNFISATLPDFVDARYRSVSMADIFPDGYRRWMANNLTGDDFIKGPRVSADASGQPTIEATGTSYPDKGIAWTSWWKATPEFCFPSTDSLVCATAPTNTAVLDPQVGWETQKFLIAMTMEYLPENAKQKWLAQMGIWELGSDTDPGFANRIELHLPNGKVYIARTYGKEVIFGKTVQKGIAARMLEYANGLLQNAYYVDNGDDVDGDGTADWYVPHLYNGSPRVKYDPNITSFDANGNATTNPTCRAGNDTNCACSANASCVTLENYAEVPFFMRQAMKDYGLADPSMKGIY